MVEGSCGHEPVHANGLRVATLHRAAGMSTAAAGSAEEQVRRMNSAPRLVSVGRARVGATAMALLCMVEGAGVGKRAAIPPGYFCAASVVLAM